LIKERQLHIPAVGIRPADRALNDLDVLELKALGRASCLFKPYPRQGPDHVGADGDGEVEGALLGCNPEVPEVIIKARKDALDALAYVVAFCFREILRQGGNQVLDAPIEHATHVRMDYGNDLSGQQGHFASQSARNRNLLWALMTFLLWFLL